MSRAANRIFVINLAESKERWLDSQKQLAGFEFERVQAVDGAKLDMSELYKHFDQRLNRQQYHKILTPGEIGCYLSHRKVWQRIVDENLDFGIVLEDDFINRTDIKVLINDIAQINCPWHCIKLAEYPIKRKAVFSQKIGNANLVTYNKVPARTCAQVISLTGAKHLLAMSEKFGRPVDIDIQHWWEGGLQVFGLQPYPFEINQSMDSDIENKGERKKSKVRYFFKMYKQVVFYFKNKRQRAALLPRR